MSNRFKTSLFVKRFEYMSLILMDGEVAIGLIVNSPYSEATDGKEVDPEQACSRSCLSCAHCAVVWRCPYARQRFKESELTLSRDDSIH